MKYLIVLLCLVHCDLFPISRHVVLFVLLSVELYLSDFFETWVERTFLVFLVDIYDTSILMTCGRLYILKEIILSIFIRIRKRHIVFLATVPCKVGFISSLPFHWGYNTGGGIILLWRSLNYDFSPYKTLRLCLLFPMLLFIPQL